MKKNQMSKGLMVQTILLMILIVLMILSIFNNIFLPIADFLAGIIFFIFVYNKKNEFGKPTLIALVLFGIFFISLGIYNLING